ncbi:MAG: porin family protein [Ferruginibacter sp.]
MKKIISTLFLCAAFQLILPAQHVSIGISAGAAISNYKTKDQDVSVSLTSRKGITAGIVANIVMSKFFSVQPALNFIQYGTSHETNYNGITEKSKANVNCLELPLNFIANIPLTKGGFFIGAGPSVTLAFSGKNKYSNSTSGNLESKLKFGNKSDDDMKMLNIGANILGGYRFENGIFLSFNYNIGFTNLIPQPATGQSAKSHYIGLRLGYFLKNNKS